MALLELIGRLGLNTQPFESGLRRARGQADSSARDISRSFTRVGLGLLGISSVGGTFNRIINQTIAWSKDIDAAREEFKRLGLEIDEGALRSIRQTGIELERLKLQLAAGATPIVALGANLIDRITDNMAIAMSRAVGLFDKEAGARFESNVERKALARQMALIGSTTPEEQAAFMADRLKGLDKAKKIAEPIVRRPQETNLPSLEFGSLAKVGGFGAIAQQTPMRQVERLVFFSQQTARNTELTAEQLREFRQEQQFVSAREEFMQGFKQL